MRPDSDGKVIFIGAGPGDPGLITVKGLDSIQSADVIICHYGINTQLISKIQSDAEVIFLETQHGSYVSNQKKINRLMIEKAREGKIIARITSEDPFSSDCSSYEAQVLAEAGIPFEIIPGVSPAIASADYAGIPLMTPGVEANVILLKPRRGKSKTDLDISWIRAVNRSTILISLDQDRDLAFLAHQLKNSGISPDVPAAVISCGASSKQRVLTGTIENIMGLVKETHLLPPVVVAIGEVVKLRGKLNWFEQKPLFGKLILVTRAKEQAGSFSALLKEYGAEPVEFPTIEIVPPGSWEDLDAALLKLEYFHWLIFTSVNGVKFFMERLFEKDMDIRDLKGLKICAIGPQTATAVMAMGVKVDLVPEEYRAEAIIASLGKRKIQGLRFLMPRAEVAREVLPEELKKLGAEIVVPTAYRTIRPEKAVKEIRELLTGKKISLVTFTSSSTVRNFVEIMGEDRISTLLRGIKVASIGPITAKTATNYGIESQVIPREYTIPALAKAIVEYYQKEETV